MDEFQKYYALFYRNILLESTLYPIYNNKANIPA